MSRRKTLVELEAALIAAESAWKESGQRLRELEGMVQDAELDEARCYDVFRAARQSRNAALPKAWHRKPRGGRINSSALVIVNRTARTITTRPADGSHSMTTDGQRWRQSTRDGGQWVPYPAGSASGWLELPKRGDAE